MPRGRKPGSASGAGVVASLQGARGELLAQRDALENQISALDAALAAFGAAAAGGSYSARRAGGGGAAGARTEGVRSGSLKEFLIRVLSAAGGEMSVKDITAGVLRAGYKTRNQTLAKSVGIALTQTPGIKKVGRGKFKAV